MLFVENAPGMFGTATLNSRQCQIKTFHAAQTLAGVASCRLAASRPLASPESSNLQEGLQLIPIVVISFFATQMPLGGEPLARSNENTKVARAALCRCAIRSRVRVSLGCRIDPQRVVAVRPS